MWTRDKNAKGINIRNCHIERLGCFIENSRSDSILLSEVVYLQLSSSLSIRSPLQPEEGRANTSSESTTDVTYAINKCQEC